MSDNILHLQRDAQRLNGRQRADANVARSANEAPSTQSNQAGTKTQPPGHDPVTMSHAASQLKSLTQVAKSSSGIDMAKVERIKTAIAEGRYPLNAKVTAAKMVELSGTMDIAGLKVHSSD